MAKIEKVCPECETVFAVPPSHAERRTYCSKRCYTSAQTGVSLGGGVERVCEQCETVFKRPPSGAARFCSRACHYTFKRGGVPVTNGDGTKTCAECLEVLPLSGFYRQRGEDGTPVARCIPCVRAQHREYREQNREAVLETKRNYYRSNKEAILRYQREYARRNAARIRRRQRAYREENREEYVAYLRAYYRENRQVLLKQQREYRERNADVIRERSAKMRAKPEHKARMARYRRRYRKANRDRLSRNDQRYREANPLKIRAYQRNYKARRNGAAGTHSGADVVRLWHRQRGECIRCGERFGKRPTEGGYHVDHITPLSRGGSNWPRNLQLLCPTCNVSKQNKTPAEFTLYLKRLSAASDSVDR